MKIVAKMLKAIHAQESKAAAREKARQVAEEKPIRMNLLKKRMSLNGNKNRKSMSLLLNLKSTLLEEQKVHLINNTKYSDTDISHINHSTDDRTMNAGQAYIVVRASIAAQIEADTLKEEYGISELAFDLFSSGNSNNTHFS